MHKKKGKAWTLELAATEDILSALGKMKGKRFDVGFAVETQNVEKERAEKARGEKL